MLAETNRHPFDLPEAEAELVSGYNVEYSAMTFALFFLGEYANMLLMSVLFFILTRAALPRYRYDQLMHIGWKSFLPLSLGYLLFTVGVLTSFNWLPN
eukprot:scaffold10795_cov2277-Chaetoceros_neogracile.AAC.3